MAAALRGALVVGALLTLTGCGAAVVAALDNAMSGATKSDCAISRVLRAEPLCKAEGPPPPEENVYCYRTLGIINCYRNEDPYGTEGSRRPAGQAASGG